MERFLCVPLLHFMGHNTGTLPPRSTTNLQLIIFQMMSVNNDNLYYKWTHHKPHRFIEKMKIQWNGNIFHLCQLR